LEAGHDTVEGVEGDGVVAGVGSVVGGDVIEDEIVGVEGTGHGSGGGVGGVSAEVGAGIFDFESGVVADVGGEVVGLAAEESGDGDIFGVHAGVLEIVGDTLGPAAGIFEYFEVEGGNDAEFVGQIGRSAGGDVDAGPGGSAGVAEDAISEGVIGIGGGIAFEVEVNDIGRSGQGKGQSKYAERS